VKRGLAKSKELASARDGEGGLTALQCVCASRMPGKRLEVAKLLLDAGADPNAKTQSWSHEVDVAYFACGTGSSELLELLLARGADATAALPSAAWRKTLELAQVCLAHGAKIDEARAGGRALLNELVRWGQVAPALWLLEKGANPNLPDERGWTAVHQAASRGNERMLRAILDAGGDRAKLDQQGLAPWKIAMQANKPRMMELLASR
jgi:ankyrin repeat protein